MQMRQRGLTIELQYELLELQTGCHNLLSYAKSLTSLAAQLDTQCIESKKITLLKNDLRERMKHFAQNIDQLFKIQDYKLAFVMRDIARQRLATTGRFSFKEEEAASFAQGSKKNLREANQHIMGLQQSLEKAEKKSAAQIKMLEQERIKNNQLNQQIILLKEKYNYKIKQLKKQLQNVKNSRQISRQISRQSNKQMSRQFSRQSNLDQQQYCMNEQRRQNNSYSIERHQMLSGRRSNSQADENTRRFQFLLSSLKNAQERKVQDFQSTKTSQEVSIASSSGARVQVHLI